MTAPIYVGSARRPWEYAESLRERGAMIASDTGGGQQADFFVAGVRVTVRTTAAASLGFVIEALVGRDGFVEDVSTAAPTWTIDIVNHLLDEALPFEWAWTDNVVADERVELRCDQHNRTITVLCNAERWALLWRAGLSIPPWERAAPLRPILDNVFGSTGLTMVHGGTLGIDGRAVLISAIGGSGKSTCVVGGIRRGMTTVGDDFILLDPPPVEPNTASTVRGLYQTARLHRSSPAWSLADVEPPDIHEQWRDDDKSLVLVNKRYPGALVDAQQIHAIVVPEVGHDAPSLAPMGRMDALRAVLPSSFVLADRRPESFYRITEFVRSTPTYRLRLCSNIERNAEAIEHFLAAECT